MLRGFVTIIAAASVGLAMASAPSDAGGRGYKKSKSGTQVRGFVGRRGGYSYQSNDVANTYNDSRTRFGSVNSYRDPFSDRQTIAGPFDHGWFFDSAVAPRGGDSPYMN